MVHEQELWQLLVYNHSTLGCELYHFDIPISCLFGGKNDPSEWQRVSKPSDVAEGLIVVSSA